MVVGFRYGSQYINGLADAELSGESHLTAVPAKGGLFQVPCCRGQMLARSSGDRFGPGAPPKLLQVRTRVAPHVSWPRHRSAGT